jgi:hypothetical protein
MSPERGSLDPTAPSLLASGPERRAIAWWATLRPRVQAGSDPAQPEDPYIMRVLSSAYFGEMASLPHRIT